MAGRRRCWCIDVFPGRRADADQHRRHGVQPPAAGLSRQVGGPGGWPALPRQHPALLSGQAAGDHERDGAGVAQADASRAAAAVDDRVSGRHRYRAGAAGRRRHAAGARRGAHAHRARDPRHAGPGTDGDRAEHRGRAAPARDAARPGPRAAGTRAGHGAREPRGRAALGASTCGPRRDWRASRWSRRWLAWRGRSRRTAACRSASRRRSPSGCRADRGRAVPDRPGGAGQRPQARPRQHGRADAAAARARC